MIEAIADRLPSLVGFICIALSFLIPFGIYTMNKKLHKIWDQPWKKEEN